MSQAYDIVIAGAGIAGVSAAYFLSTRYHLSNILLVDPRPPLTLTTDNSTECYRNWWPGPDQSMVSLMNRSIDLLEELADKSSNVFHLNRRGYLYVTGNSIQLPSFIDAAERISGLGSGELRIHRGKTGDPHYEPAHPSRYQDQPSGADLFLDPGLIQSHFPGITSQAVAALHVRRAGWFSAQQLGMYMLEEASRLGVSVLPAEVSGVKINKGRISGIHTSTGEYVETRCFINAAGPGLKHVAQLTGIDLPVYSELHLKVAVQDPLGVVDRHAPLLIWSDPQYINWSDEEREILAEDPATAELLGELPSGVHTRPEGGPGSQVILVLWEYHTQMMEPIYPLPKVDAMHTELVLRGLSRLLPGMQAYQGRLPRPRIDGGYYIKTKENRPLIGDLPIEGAYMIGALSGFGLMAACGAGELLAAHVTGSELPDYAPAFNLNRYQDPSYLELLLRMGIDGQL